MAVSWQQKTLVGADYRLFFHLINDGGQIVAQKDIELGYLLTDPYLLDHDQLLAQTLLIPANTLPNSNYILTMGIYNINADLSKLDTNSIIVGNLQIQ